MLDGEYGYKDIFLGVPVMIGPNGLEKIIEIPLSDAEKQAMEASVKMVQEGIDSLSELV